MDNTFFYWDDITADEEGLKEEFLDELEFERLPAFEEDEYYILAEVDYEGWD